MPMTNDGRIYDEGTLQGESITTEQNRHSVPVCSTCGKPIEHNPNPFGQSAWRHTNRTGAGVGGHADNWCETERGYVKVAPTEQNDGSV